MSATGATMVIDPLPFRINWASIMTDLAQQGISGYQVAQILGIEWSTVQHFSLAKRDIGFGYGIALLCLHRDRCGPQTTEFRLTEAKKAA